jgi:hypothetical protein
MHGTADPIRAKEMMIGGGDILMMPIQRLLQGSCYSPPNQPIDKNKAFGDSFQPFIDRLKIQHPPSPSTIEDLT